MTKASFRDAVRLLGKEAVKSMLPAPFDIIVSDHDTGCQISIWLAAEGKPSILAWQTSIWYSSKYEFNDRDKIMGLQPACEFARPSLDRFFAQVQDACVARHAERAAAIAAVVASKEKATAEALDAYRAMLTN